MLQAPLSALFRCGAAWCVFVVEGNRARRREVQVGHFSAGAAEILTGLAASERVVKHPPNELDDGARVKVGG